jgi:hypothetical protein
LVIGILGLSIYQKLLKAEESRLRVGKLPELDMMYVSKRTSNIDSTSSKPTIFSYINTNCRFCLAEIESIRQHPNLQNSARIVFVSDESKRRLELFTRSLGLDTLSVEMAWDSSGVIKSLFGIKSVPTTYVYGQDRILIEHIKGATTAESLYQLVN